MSDAEQTPTEINWRDKAAGLYQVAIFRPTRTLAIVVLSVIAAGLEGFGLSFILPIVELTRSGGTPPESAGGLMAIFIRIYEVTGVPFTMGYLIVGVAAVMVIRYTASFLVGWLRGALETRYVRHLQNATFDHALDAKVSYFDQEGSDNILNAIVTQAEYAGRVIRFAVMLLEQTLLAMMYIVIALFLAPMLTIAAGIFFAIVTVLSRRTIAGGYSLGDRVASAKERIQRHAQAGTQGIREVKIFGMEEELRSGFTEATEVFERAQIKLRRNHVGMQNFYQLTTAIMVFVLIYAALSYSSLSLGSLGVFLFAMFRLSPRLSNVNQLYYRLEGQLPHLVRTQEFLRDLEQSQKQNQGSEEVPKKVTKVEFTNVSFTYQGNGEPVLNDLSYEVSSDEYIAFVGQSGEGKSTIVSLLTRMYEPDDGEIRANGVRIVEFDVQQWRSKLAVVRQNPFIFNDTLMNNVSVGNREASREDIERVCAIAKVDQFVDELPEGYSSILGDDGVRLSGGQRQRVALARALLQDADVLILDEATSDLDSSMEKEVQSAIESMEGDQIIIAIAHRLSTVKNADRIYTVQDGRITEAGSHEELISKGGQYAELYRIQTEKT